jgi:hypothetical protein
MVGRKSMEDKSQGKKFSNWRRRRMDGSRRGKKDVDPHLDMERKIEEALGKLLHLSIFLFFEILFKL